MIELKKRIEASKVNRWIRFSLIALLSVVSTNLFATDYFWVGNSGNWNDNNHWSLSSGGNGGAGVPTINDNAFFDASSFTANSLVQINSVANCKNLVWEGTIGSHNLSGTAELNIKGDFIIVDKLKNEFTGNINLLANSGTAIIKAGEFQWFSNILINGGATFSMLNDFGTLKTNTITLRKGTLNTNNHVLYTGTFQTETNKPKNVNLGTSNVRIFEKWDVETGSNINLEASTSNIEWDAQIPMFDILKGNFDYGIIGPKFACANGIDFTATVTSNWNGAQLRCNGSCDAEITVVVNGGSGGPYGYNVTDGALVDTTQGTTSGGTVPDSSVFNGLCAGTYNVTVFDSAQLIFGTVYESCTDFGGIVIADPPAIGINVLGFIDPTCPNACDGTIFTNIGGGTGALTISWPTIPFNGPNPNIACTGTHAVEVTDINLCFFTADVTVTDPPPILPNLTVYPVSCNNVCDGSIMSVPSGGNGGPYTFVWDGGLTPFSDSATNLCELTTYNVIISDVNGCTQAASALVPDRDSITITVVNPVNPTCFGLCNGEMSLLLSGGSGTYVAVDWFIGILGGGSIPFTATSLLNSTNLCAGVNYKVVVTDNNGCQDSLQLPMLTQSNQLVISETHIDLLCFGDGNGSITTTTVGGTPINPAPSYTYQWTVLVPGGGENPISQNQTTLSGGDYQVVATDALGCTDTLVVSVFEPTQIFANGIQTNNACYDSLNASINQTVVGGMGPGVYTYTWTSSAIGFTDPSTENLIGLDSGLYTVSIIDTNGCQLDTSYTISTPGELFANASITPVSCNGNANGDISLSPTNGTTPYEYDMSNTGIYGPVSTIPGLVQGSYTVSVRDSSLCVKDTIIIITEPSLLIFTETHTNISCFGANDGTINLTISGGTSLYTTIWAPGNPMVIANNILNPSGLIQGTYDVTLTDNNGCTAALSIFISEPVELVLTLNITDLTCAGVNDGAINLTVVGGTGGYTYDWDNNGTGSYTDPQSIAALSAGMYCVSVRDNTGCQKDSCQIPIIEPDSIHFGATVITPVLCFGTNTGAINIAPQGGTPFIPAPNYVYTWSSIPANFLNPGTQNISGLAPDTYNILLTDANGCTNDTTITLFPPVQITGVLDSTNSSCSASNGTVSAIISGGAGDQSYVWTDGTGTQVGGNTATVTGLPADCYNLLYTDLNGCPYTDQVCVVNDSAPTVTFTITDLNCYLSANGSIISTITGGAQPYIVSWTSTDPGFPNPTNTQDIFGLTAADYTINVTDANNCIFTQTVIISEPTQVFAGGVAVIVTDVLCFGDSTGAINIAPTGGTVAGAYTYSWTGPGFTASTEDVSNIPIGLYCVRITDDNGCFIDTCINVNEPTQMTLVYSTNPAQCTLSDGDATVTPSGGTTPAYSYLWPSSNTNTTETNIGAGTYMVYVTDGNACQDSILVTVSEDNGPIIVIDSSNNISCNGICDGMIATTVTGINTFTILWSNSSTVDDISSLCAGTYVITAIDDTTSCQVSQSIVITEPAIFDVPGAVTDVSCFGGSTGSIVLTPVGGTAPYDFDWDNNGAGFGDPQDLTNVIAGTYNVIGRDANGCLSNGNFTIIEPTQITAITTSTTTSSCGVSDGSVTVVASSGTPGTLPNDYFYLWSEVATGINVGNTTTVFNLPAGCYTVDVTDGVGCVVQDTVCITDGGATPLVVVPTNITCFGANDGIINVTLTGQDSLVWSGPQPIANDMNPAMGLISGSYTATLTDNGCVSATTVNIIEPLQITLSATLVDPPCAGAFTGSITLVINDTIGGATASWTGPNGFTASTIDISTLEAGQYCVTVTDGNGCQASTCYTLIDNPTMSLVASSVPTACSSPTGQVNVVATGGIVATDYVYLWSEGSTTAAVTGLAAGIYTVTVTDDLNCQATASTTVSPFNGPTVTLTSVTNVSCFGANDGAIFVNTTGGATPYTFSWNTGATTEDIVNVGPGYDTLTVVDNDGCTVFLSDSVTEPSPLSVSGIRTDLTCNGDGTGAFNITISGGTTPYTNNWLNSIPLSFSINEDVNGLSAGVYVDSIIDGNGCLIQYIDTIIEPTAIVLTTGVLNSTCLLFDGAASVAATGGAPGYSYSWVNVTAGTPIATNNDTITNLAAGSYQSVVTDANGCSDSATIAVTDATGPSVTNVVTNVVCFGDGNGAINLTVIEPLLTFVWTGPVGFIDPGTQGLTNLDGGTYTVIVTNPTGCSTTQVIVVGGPTAPISTTAIITNLTCFNDVSGAINITTTGGTPSLIIGYTYSWTGPNGFISNFEDISALDSGAYTLSIVDSNVCNYAVTYNITQPDSLALNAVAVNATCGLQDGSITTAATGGDGSYTYVWSEAITGPLSPGTNASETTLGAGVYTIVVTDGVGCSTTETIPITDANAAPLSTVDTNVTCNGFADGSINLTVNGPNTYSYVWTGTPPYLGATTEDISGLDPGTYNVQVTDNTLGCISTASIVITEPQALSITGVSNNVSCFGVADGDINITVSGGMPSYTYAWVYPDLSTSIQENITSLDTGVYQVTSTDLNGCQVVAQYTITEPNSILVSALIVNDSCFQGGNGSIDITTSQGTTPYTYSWSWPGNTSSNEDLTLLLANTYNLTILDSNNCQKDTLFTITELSQIVANVVVTDANCTFSDGSAVSTTSGGVGGYTYSWAPTNPSVTNSILNVPSGIYPLQIIDANLCQFDTTITINDIGGPTITVVNVIDVSCFGGSDGGVDVTVTGMNPPFTYLWNPNAISQVEDLINAPANVYTYQVTDALGCNTFETATINEPSELTGTYTTVDATCGLCNGSATIIPTGGTAGYSFVWSDNQTGITATNLCAGVLTVQITDLNNCVANVNVGVSSVGGPTGESIVITDVTCAGGNDGTADVTPVGGTLPYTYYWPHNGSTANPITGLGAGNYFVEVSDANGCLRVGEVIITESTIIASTAIITPATCGGTDGAIMTTTTGGSGAYTYVWSPGIATGSDTTATGEGVYTLMINDGNCSIIEIYTIPGIGAPELTLIPTNTNCFNSSDGGISSAVSNNVGLMSYQWYDLGTTMPGETNNSLANISSGTYTLEGLDAGTGCMVFATVSLASPDSIVLSIPTVIDASCSGVCDGDASVIVSGGVLPYTYVWSQNSSITNNATSLCAGTDTVAITDANSCVITTGVIVNEPSAISIITDSITDAFCVNTNDGEIFITANGGSGVYTYSWISIPTGFVSSSEDLTALYPMNYEITVIDGNGCSSVDTAIVDTLNVLVAMAGIDSSVCAGSCINLIGVGFGTNTFTLEWFDITGTSVAANDTFQLCPTTGGLEMYVLVATDQQCSNSDTINVTVHTLAVVDAGIDYVEIFGSTVVLGGSPTATSGAYQWSPTINFIDSLGTNANPEVLVNSNEEYVVTVTDSNGCVNSDTVNIEIFPEINIPNGFSPNSDGVNDRWQIDNMIQFPDAVVEVYNRWGQQLFISVGYVQEFDGTYKGKQLPVGTYYYIIVLNHPEYPDAYTGPITIMR